MTLCRIVDRSTFSFKKFQDQFESVAVQLFGSGWVWLCVDQGGLKIVAKSNADSPLCDNYQGLLLVCDVWEHSYYLDYRQVRADFLKQFWSIVNWNFVSNNFNQCLK